MVHLIAKFRTLYKLNWWVSSINLCCKVHTHFNCKGNTDTISMALAIKVISLNNDNKLLYFMWVFSVCPYVGFCYIYICTSIHQHCARMASSHKMVSMLHWNLVWLKCIDQNAIIDISIWYHNISKYNVMHYTDKELKRYLQNKYLSDRKRKMRTSLKMNAPNGKCMPYATHTFMNFGMEINQSHGQNRHMHDFIFKADVMVLWQAQHGFSRGNSEYIIICVCYICWTSMQQK